VGVYKAPGGNEEVDKQDLRWETSSAPAEAMLLHANQSIPFLKHLRRF
jgi:hypothetical protein